MIHKDLIIIRLFLLMGLIGVMHVGYAPLLGFLVRTTVQRDTGGQLDIENLDASPFGALVSTGRVGLVRPENSPGKLFQFNDAEFKLDWSSLLHRKFILTNGSVNGLKLGKEAGVSGRSGKELENKPELVNDLLMHKGRNIAPGLMSSLTRQFNESFETPRYSRELVERWPKQHRQLFLRGKEVENQIREIQEIVNSFANSPLNTIRDLPRIEKAIKSSAKIRNELLSIRNKVGQFRTQVIQDRNNLIAGMSRDLARIEKITTVTRLDGQALSQLLVGKQQEQRVEQVISWVKWMKTAFSHSRKPIPSGLARGKTVRFRGQLNQPDFVVQALQLNGHGTFGQQSFTFSGSLVDFSTKPEVFGKPAHLQLKAEGGLRFAMKARIDRIAEEHHDRITISLPEIKTAPRELDIDDSVRLKLGPGNLQVTVGIDRVGEQVRGQVKAVQTNVDIGIVSDLGNAFATQVESTINQQLKSIRNFEIVASVSGSLQEANWQLHCDLGPQIAGVIDNTLALHYQAKRKELIARLNQHASQSLEKVTDLLNQEQRLLAYVTEKSRDVFKLGESVTRLLQTSGLRLR